MNNNDFYKDVFDGIIKRCETTPGHLIRITNSEIILLFLLSRNYYRIFLWYENSRFYRLSDIKEIEKTTILQNIENIKLKKELSGEIKIII